MASKTLKDREKILLIIKHLVSNKKEINVRFEGESTVFTSRFIKIDKDKSPSEMPESLVIIEKLTPNKGNELIQSVQQVVTEFLFQEKSCQCALKTVGISSTPPYFGFILRLPESIEIVEKRSEGRQIYDVPDFISAEFQFGREPEEEKLYELTVTDCSGHGLGLIITNKEVDLLKKLKKGDRIRDISFYTPWAVVRVDGVVKHITEIHEGKYKGCYLMGIESQDIIESCRPKDH